MKTCAGCGEQLSDRAKKCRKCGMEIEGAGAAKPAAIQPGETRVFEAAPAGRNRKIIYIVAAVLAVIVAGIFITKSVIAPKPGADMAVQGEQAAQTDAQVSEAPAGSTDSQKAAADKAAKGIEGKWEGTFTEHQGPSGYCSVNVTKGKYLALCYDSRITGSVRIMRKGEIEFEAPNNMWRCTQHLEKGKTILRCQYNVKSGASSSVGSLSLHRAGSTKGKK